MASGAGGLKKGKIVVTIRRESVTRRREFRRISDHFTKFASRSIFPCDPSVRMYSEWVG